MVAEEFGERAKRQARWRELYELWGRTWPEVDELLRLSDNSAHQFGNQKVPSRAMVVLFELQIGERLPEGVPALYLYSAGVQKLMADPPAG